MKPNRMLAGITAAAALASAAIPSDLTGQAQPRDGAVTDHVVVISIDGLRPDAIERYGARTLQRLMREGTYARDAQTITPSRTLPSHTSMLTGVPPAVHGITWNDDRTAEHGTVRIPTVFGLAKAAGFATAAFFSKSKLRHLQQPGTLDHSMAPSGLEVYSAAETVEQAVRYMGYRRPGLLFVHIAEPDAAGHSVGWMSFAYGWAVRRADGAVQAVLAAAERSYGAGNYTVIVTADHGGHGRGHGDTTGDDMHIPWIAWGAGVRPGTVLSHPVNTVDTAATVLWLLGVSAPVGITGVPVSAAYTPAAQVAAGAAAAGRM